MKFKKKLDDKDIKQIEYLSGIRVPMEHIAGAIGVSKDTLERMVKKNDAVRAAIDTGRSKATTKVRGTLYSEATGSRPVVKMIPILNDDGTVKRDKRGQIQYEEEVISQGKPPDIQALKFWCETQEGFKRTEVVEMVGRDGGPVKIQNLSDEELEAELEAARKLAKATSAKAK